MSGTLPNVIVAGVIDAIGASAVPVSMMVFGELAALELIVIVPVNGPITLGANARFNTQLDAGAMLIGLPVFGDPLANEPKPHQWAAFGAGPPVLSGNTLALE